MTYRNEYSPSEDRTIKSLTAWRWSDAAIAKELGRLHGRLVTAEGIRGRRKKIRALRPKGKRGEQVSKLKAWEAKMIRESTQQTKKLAELFGVSRSTVKKIRAGHTWAWLK